MIIRATLREIKNTMGRFMGILIIITLGCAFYTGLKSVEPDMKLSAEKYFKQNNFMDFHLLSTMGFNDEDVNSVKNIKGVGETEAAYSFDAIGSFGEETRVVRLSSVPRHIDLLILKEGRLPEKSGECVLLSKRGGKNIKPGDMINLNSGTDKDITETIKNKTYTVVGVAANPLYITRVLGASKIGNGSIQEIAYIPDEDFNLEVYTDIYVTIEGADEFKAFSKEYYNFMSQYETSLVKLGENRSNAHYDEIKAVAIKELSKKKSEYNEAVKNDIKKPKWYILDRQLNAGYADFEGDTERIGGLSEVFPAMFFIIAALVCLTSTTRMVDEQRTQIGTMKALGYSKARIAFKYIFYVASASVIGSVFGFFIGFRFIPVPIFKAYKALYNLPLNALPIYPQYALSSAVVSIAVTVLAVYFTCYAALFAVPASLMRPHAPKPGKRLLIERFDFFWKRLKFSQKVTVRNIFRYKKRFLMTVFGVTCCCALVISGIGLKNSIKVPAERQFSELFTYNSFIRFKDDASEKEKQNILSFIENEKIVAEWTRCFFKTIELENGKKRKEIILIVPQNNEELGKFIKLRTPGKGMGILLSDKSAVVTEKVSEMPGVVNDGYVEVFTADEETLKIKITDVCENYLLHYLFMSKEYYRSVFGEEAIPNQIIINQTDTSTEAQSRFGELVTGIEGVSSIGFLSDTQKNLNDILKSLDLIVWVIIISAAVLAFVVLYTLTTININERVREIATIKVLGFYNKEVNSYIFRESYILTLLGILFGSFVGIFMHRYILKSAANEQLMYYKRILPLSFVYSGILTFMFSIVVNWLLQKKMKVINMVEALKSVE